MEFVGAVGIYSNKYYLARDFRRRFFGTGTILDYQDNHDHKLPIPNEGMNQRNLKIWANVVDKICFGRTKNLGVGVDFRPCSEGNFLTGRP